MKNKNRIELIRKRKRKKERRKRNNMINKNRRE